MRSASIMEVRCVIGSWDWGESVAPRKDFSEERVTRFVIQWDVSMILFLFRRWIGITLEKPYLKICVVYTLSSYAFIT